MQDVTGLVARALAGEVRALEDMVDALTPVIQARVARALLRASTARRDERDLRQDVEDFTQEVFVAIFADNGRALRSWDPARGLSLVNFVGLIAQREVASILRNGKRSPWTEEPTVSPRLERAAGDCPALELDVSSREFLAKLLDRLHAELSPRGHRLFQLLVVEELPARDVCTQLGMTLDAVYAWRCRLGRTLRHLTSELEAWPEGCTAAGVAAREERATL